jgi:hypothetical protein
VRLPDFIIIGAAKAGTTSLYAILDRHPDIFMPDVKEPEFFARDELYAKGIASYAKAYASATPEQLTGEASTLYSLAPHFPHTAERIKRNMPKVKLIYVLREPVSRAYSYYLQIIKNYQNVTGDLTVHRTFEEFIMPDRKATAAPREMVLSRANAHLPDVPGLCLDGSDYVRQIESYLAHFSREAILFVKFESFVRDAAATTREITDFLGLDPIHADVFADDGVTQNVSRAHFDDVAARVAVGQMRNRFGGAWAMRKLMPDSGRQWLRRVLTRGAKTPAAYEPKPMESATRQLLTDRYAAQRAQLMSMTGLNLDDWRT